MSEINTSINEKLPMQLDSISWNKKFDLLAIGAYMIDSENSTKRVGKVFLIQLKTLNGEGKLYDIIQEINISGVLDLRWESNFQSSLAVATSDSFELYELLHNDSYQLNFKSKLQLDSMALYTQWMDSQKLIYSDSEGKLNIVSTNPLEIQKFCKIHDNLTWVVQYSSNSDLVFAGSDEGKFTGFKLDNINEEEKHYTKKFPVGVTSIIFIKDNLLGVGSYDDTLRLFTIDNSEPIILSLKKKIEFGGAVWRTISEPVTTACEDQKDRNECEDFHIIAACARNGIHIVSLNTRTWASETIVSCLDHEGYLAYGLDVKVNTPQDNCRIYEVASCYFDNHQLHTWTVSVPNNK